jgi:hypothetical protein
VCILNIKTLTSIKRNIIIIIIIISPFSIPKFPAEFAEFINIFNIKKAGVLPAYSKNKYIINLNGNKPPFGPLYNLLTKELEVLRTYLNAVLAKGWVQRSTSPTGAPVLFIPKKGGGLRLYIDYRGLNKIIIKNKYPFPLITETLNHLISAIYYIKLNLKNAYHRLKIKAGDK